MNGKNVLFIVEFDSYISLMSRAPSLTHFHSTSTLRRNALVRLDTQQGPVSRVSGWTVYR